MARFKHYVGYKEGKATVFSSFAVPTQESHGSLYNATVGPFRTKRGAEFMRDYGANNPHCQTVGQAEKLAAMEAEKKKGKKRQPKSWN